MGIFSADLFSDPVMGMEVRNSCKGLYYWAFDFVCHVLVMTKSAEPSNRWGCALHVPGLRPHSRERLILTTYPGEVKVRNSLPFAHSFTQSCSQLSTINIWLRNVALSTA